MSELPHQSTRKAFRRRFVVDVTWDQPAEQPHADDWTAVMSDALTNEGTCLFDIASGPLVELKPEVVTDGAG